MKKKESPRILIFNVNWLGDVLFSTAAIRNIRYNFPDSFIACAVPSRCYPILKGNPNIDEIIIYDEKDRHRSFLSKCGFIKFLKSRNFDKVFLLHRSFTRTLICRLAGIPEKIGYYTQKRSFLLDKKIPAPDPHALHRIDYYLKLIEGAGLKVEDRYTEFFFSPEDQDYVDEFLKRQGVSKNDILIGINPGGNWMPKRWPKANWISLSEKLSSDPGTKIVITGGPSDRQLAEGIKDEMTRKPVIACGVFNLKQLGALCKRLDVFITADTGPLHIANSVRAKNIVALFGPTSPEITGPFPADNAAIVRKDVGCRIPCYVVNCRQGQCMKAITPEDVYLEVKRLLKK